MGPLTHDNWRGWWHNKAMFRGARSLAAAAATTALVVATSVCTAQAAATVGTCTLTAIAPVLSAGNVYGSATIKCTAATSFTGKLQIVELEYDTAKKISASSPEDTTMPSTASVALTAVSIAKNATVTVCIPGGPLVAPATKCTTTLPATCGTKVGGFNTEADNEEWATKISATIPGVASDRTLPKDQAFAC